MRWLSGLHPGPDPLGDLTALLQTPVAGFRGR